MDPQIPQLGFSGGILVGLASAPRVVTGTADIRRLS